MVMLPICSERDIGMGILVKPPDAFTASGICSMFGYDFMGRKEGFTRREARRKEDDNEENDYNGACAGYGVRCNSLRQL